MLSNILQSASGTVNSIFLGRILGVHALAAASGIFPVFFLLVSFLIGISSGSTVLIGQAYGARDEHKMKAIAGATLGLSFWLGVIVAFVGLFFAHDLLLLLNTPAAILADSTRYAQVIFAPMPFFFPYVVYTTLLRGTGDSQTPFYFLVVSTLISIVVTPALILGWLGLPHLGIISPPIAFIVSNFIAFAAFLVFLQMRRHVLRFDGEMLRDAISIDWKIVATVVRIGIPAGFQLVMVSLAEIAVLSFVNRFGYKATAAYGAVNQVVSYVQFPAMSIGITASIFGAQCIGAHRQDRLNAVIRSGVGLNYAFGAVLIGICYLFSWDILGWFITSPATLNIAHGLLMITLWSYLLFGNSAVLSGIMRSSGTVFWPTVIGIFAIWGVEVPSAYLLMQRFAIDGVWMGYPIAFAVGLCLQFTYYELFWKHKTHQRLI